MLIKKTVSAAMKFPYGARRGAICGAIATVIWAACSGAVILQSGFGWFADLLFVGILAFVGIPLAALIIALTIALVRLLPPLFTGFLLACAAFVSLLWIGVPGFVFGAFLVAVECALGATVAMMARGELRGKPRWRQVAVWGVLLLTIGLNIGIFRFLHSDGIEEELLQIKQAARFLPPPSAAQDPSKPGPYRVRTLYYGSGDSLRRPEFGPSVSIRTRVVDGSHFMKEFTGWKRWLRDRYWGFGLEKLPLNARVFYPDGSGPFPLFVMVHGNHQMSAHSDEGYAYLCELLASRGFITVSVDENFLNIGFSYDPPKQQPLRGWLLLEHLKLWHEWAKDPRSPFYGKVDLQRIALGGHSRGGEAAATAALFNKLDYFPDDAAIRFHYGYAIKSVIAIAPVDGQYKPAERWRVLNDVNYLTLQGANDSDLASFLGSRQYENVQFSGKVPLIKAEIYIYRANHGQFNTVWGRTDQAAPISWFLNLRPLMEGDAQRQIAKVYISAFLEATLHGRTEYADLFRDYRTGRRWLPDTLYVSRFEDQSNRTICNFSEDADVTTTTMQGGHIASHGLTIWREGKIPFRDGNRDYNGAFVGWNWDRAKKPPATAPDYVIDIPARIGAANVLSLSIAATDDDAPEPGKLSKPDDESDEISETTDFSIEATSANGACARLEASRFMTLLPPIHVRFTKLGLLDEWLYKESAEPVFQTIRIPLSAFANLNLGFDPHQVRRVRLIFDKTPSRVLIISGIGLEGA